MIAWIEMPECLQEAYGMVGKARAGCAWPDDRRSRHYVHKDTYMNLAKESALGRRFQKLELTNAVATMTPEPKYLATKKRAENPSPLCFAA